MSHHQSRQIAVLREKILHVGACVEAAIRKAVSAVINRDATLAATIIDEDDVIDQLEVEVEEECMKTLALYQPVAADLRLVVSILKINNDLERMGDLAKNIAKRALFLSQASVNEFSTEIRVMADKVQAMVKHSLDALVEQDAALARSVRVADDEIDALNKQFQATARRNLRESPEQIEMWLKWSSVGKHLNGSPTWPPTSPRT